MWASWNNTTGVFMFLRSQVAVYTGNDNYDFIVSVAIYGLIGNRYSYLDMRIPLVTLQ